MVSQADPGSIGLTTETDHLAINMQTGRSLSCFACVVVGRGRIQWGTPLDHRANFVPHKVCEAKRGPNATFSSVESWDRWRSALLITLTLDSLPPPIYEKTNTEARPFQALCAPDNSEKTLWTFWQRRELFTTRARNLSNSHVCPKCMHGRSTHLKNLNHSHTRQAAIRKETPNILTVSPYSRLKQ